MADNFSSHADGVMSPARNAVAVTPGTTELTITKALYVGTGGTLVAEMVGGGICVFTNVQDGAIIPIRVRRVLTADNSSPQVAGTASGIVALY